jgi:hypothetical protein
MNRAISRDARVMLYLDSKSYDNDLLEVHSARGTLDVQRNCF